MTKVRSHPIYAALYDRLNEYAETDWLGRIRQQIAERAHGTVLEIGAGTGMNLLRFKDVDDVIAAEPDPAYRKRLVRRVPDAVVPVRVIDATAEDLPLPDQSVDTVVSTLTLCSVDDPAQAAAEMARVLRPGGQVLLFEHVRNNQVLQRLCGPVWRLLAGGCRLNRPTLDTLRANGFEVEVVGSLNPPGTPRFMFPFVTAVAHPIRRPVMPLPVLPGRLPLLGHALTLVRSPLELMRDADPRDDVAVLYGGWKPWYLVSSPTLARRILVDDARQYDRGMVFEAVARIVGRTSLTGDGELHKQRRRMVQPALDRRRIPEYAPTMATAAQDMVTSWEDGARLPLYDLISNFAFDVVTRTLVTAGIDEARVTDFKRYLPLALAGVTKSMYDPTGLMKRIPTPGNRRTNHAIKQVRATIGDAIAHHRASATADHGDVLSMLIRDGHGLSDKEISNEAMALLVAGTETVTSALCWAIHLLTTHPKIEQRLHAELNEVLAGRPPGIEDLPKLDYTRRLFMEVMRLYPPGWLVSRRTLTEAQLGDVFVPPRTPVFVCLYLLHRRPEHFPDPERFDPDRWLPDRAQALPREAYLPFGTGPHQCPGDHFAVTMACLLLAALAQRWQLTAVGAPVTQTTTPTLRPSHVDVTVTAR